MIHRLANIFHLARVALACLVFHHRRDGGNKRNKSREEDNDYDDDDNENVWPFIRIVSTC